MNEYTMVLKSMRLVLFSRGLYLLTKILTIVTLVALAIVLALTGKLMLTEGISLYIVYVYTDGKVMMLKAVYDDLRIMLKGLDPEE